MPYKAKKIIWLTLLQYLLYRSGLEPNPQYLQIISVLIMGPCAPDVWGHSLDQEKPGGLPSAGGEGWGQSPIFGKVPKIPSLKPLQDRNFPRACIHKPSVDM